MKIILIPKAVDANTTDLANNDAPEDLLICDYVNTISHGISSPLMQFVEDRSFRKD